MRERACFCAENSKIRPPEPEITGSQRLVKLAGQIFKSA